MYLIKHQVPCSLICYWDSQLEILEKQRSTARNFATVLQWSGSQHLAGYNGIGLLQTPQLPAFMSIYITLLSFPLAPNPAHNAATLLAAIETLFGFLLPSSAFVIPGATPLASSDTLFGFCFSSVAMFIPGTTPLASIETRFGLRLPSS